MEIHDVRYYFLPYCIQRTRDGRYAITNRRYKPLGTLSTEWVNYEEHSSTVHLDITPTLAKQLSWRGEDDIESIYLYNDATNPLRSEENLAAYFKRLELLMKLTVAVP